jgi:hypothetical protein
MTHSVHINSYWQANVGFIQLTISVQLMTVEYQLIVFKVEFKMEEICL